MGMAIFDVIKEGDDGLYQSLSYESYGNSCFTKASLRSGLPGNCRGYYAEKQDGMPPKGKHHRKYFTSPCS